jgi:hypothetical protein
MLRPGSREERWNWGVTTALCPSKLRQQTTSLFTLCFPSIFCTPKYQQDIIFFKKNVDEQQRQAKFLERTLPLSEEESLSLTKFGNKN